MNIAPILSLGLPDDACVFVFGFDLHVRVSE